jgi:retron-type reverse transcriptase
MTYLPAADRYTMMSYRRCGRSGLKLPVVSLGLWQNFGNDRPLDTSHALYRAAKADPGRRFHALQDKIYRRDVLWRAWVTVQRNGGAPGIDKTSLADVEEYGVVRLLGELAIELREGRYRPLPLRRVFIPKPGTVEQRPLSIPAVRDRIVQAACKIVLEPVFEADMLPCSFGVSPEAGGARCPAGSRG